MKALWLFVFLIIFCIYVLFGLYLTENTDSLIQLILTWVIYTILWTTLINVFLLGYFWSVVRTKNGPAGLRGPSGGRGILGIQGRCSITATQAYCIKAISEYIDSLYKAKTGENILDEEVQTFPNKYLTDKIVFMAGSRQYQVIVANLSTDNKPVDSIVNYLKSIWSIWFDLIYKATTTPGAWFKFKFADDTTCDDNHTLWPTNNNPFDEIKKYDIFYWGLTRNFRPLKAEICRSPEKLPIVNKELASQARLKIIYTNDYYYGAIDRHTDHWGNAAFWQPKLHYRTLDNSWYFPVGSVMTAGHDEDNVWGAYHDPITVGESGEYSQPMPRDSDGHIIYNGPAFKTVLVTGDVKDPIGYTETGWWGGDDSMKSYKVNCPTGYVSLGDVMARYDKPQSVGVKCIPDICAEPISKAPSYPWGGDEYVNTRVEGDNTDASVLLPWHDPKNMPGVVQREMNVGNIKDYGYNLTRLNSDNPFYKIRESCLSDTKIAPNYPPAKDLEPNTSNVGGIGWYGHPYKLQPKYSIFTFLNLIPEGLIVHQGTGRRFYIIFCGGENDPNIFNVLDYNNTSGKFDNALELGTNNESDVYSNPIDRTNANTRQQWKIILQQNGDKKNKLKLQNVRTNSRYLSLALDPKTGKGIFTGTTNIINTENYTNFTFISAVGTNLNVIDNV